MFKFSAKKKKDSNEVVGNPAHLLQASWKLSLSEIKIRVITCMHAESFYFHQCFTVKWKQVLKSTTVMSDNVDFKPLSSLISL